MSKKDNISNEKYRSELIRKDPRLLKKEEEFEDDQFTVKDV